MELFGVCSNCIELKKALQVESKKTVQKERLIELLRQLIQSYEAKDLNLTFNDLSQIYESSASEVTILKQRLSLYLGENQELLQLKNETASRNDFLEKKCRDMEDELSHLRFVNKQLSDYYREKETDQDQNKDRLKKLAKKLLTYEPKNSEVRKILNLQNTPIELDQKPVKIGSKKKTEEALKDMKKENVKSTGDDESSIAESSKTTDILQLQELDLSINSEYDQDITEIYNFLSNEECSNVPNSPSIQKALTENTMNEKCEKHKDAVKIQNPADKINIEAPCEKIDKRVESSISAQESTDSLNIVDSINQDTDLCREITTETSDIEINLENIQSFSDNCIDNSAKIDETEGNSFRNGDIIDRSNTNVNVNDCLEFDNSLPELISPLKSVETRVLSCEETILQRDSVICATSESVVESDVETEIVDKESRNIKNESSSNKNNKSSCSGVGTKHLNDGLFFNGKPIIENCLPIPDNYSTNYHFQSPHYMSCCNDTYAARPPVVLKLYNCSNVEISIPSSIQNQDLPVIAVRDKQEVEKSYINTSHLINKKIDHYHIGSSFNSRQTNDPLHKSCNEQPSFTHSNFLKQNNSNCQESEKESSRPYYQGHKNSGYYFLDYLSKNKINICNRPLQNYAEDNTIKCDRLFPVRAEQHFDLEQFCFKFQSLTTNCSLPKQTFSDNVASTNRYIHSNKASSMFSISKAPVFHNTLKTPLISNTRTNACIFGQNFNISTDINQQDLCNKKIILKPTPFFSSNIDENILNNRNQKFNRLQASKSDIDSSPNKNSDYGKAYQTLKNNVPVNQLHQNSNNDIKKYEQKSTKRPFKSVGFDVKPEKPVIPKKVVISESRGIIESRFETRSVEDMIFANVNKNLKSPINEPKHSRALIVNTTKPRADQEISICGTAPPSDVTGCSKSIFDLNTEKNASNISSSSCFKSQNNNPKFHTTSQEKKTTDSLPLLLSQKRCTLVIAPQQLPERVGRSRTPKISPIKEKLSCEQRVLQKSSLHKNVIYKPLIGKKPSKKKDDFFDKRSIKTLLDSKMTENKFKCKTYVNKQLQKTAVNEKTNPKMSSEEDQSSECAKLSSAYDDNSHFSSLVLAPEVNNICQSQSSQCNAVNNHTDSSAALLPKPKNAHIDQNMCTDKYKDDLDIEVQEHIKSYDVLLLSPIPDSPETSFEADISSNHDVLQIVCTSNEDSKVKDDSSKNIPETSFETDISSNQDVLQIACISTIDSEVKDNSDSKDISLLNNPSETENVIKTEVMEEHLLAGIHEEVLQYEISDNIMQANELIDKKPVSVSNLVDSKTYNIFSDDDELMINIDSELHPQEVCNINELQNKKNEDIETLLKSDTMKSYVRNKNKVLPTYNFITEKKTIFKSEEEKLENIEQISLPINNNDSDNETKPTNSSVSNDNFEYEKPLTDCGNNNSTITLGFYVNRCDLECTSTNNIDSKPQESKIECSDNSEEQTSEFKFTNKSKQISPAPVYTNSRCDVGLNEDEKQEEKPSIIKKENNDIDKNIHDRNDEQSQYTFNNKSTELTQDGNITCESDVFICALKYLSSIAVSSDNNDFDPNFQKPETSLTTKIAINHIRNLINETVNSVDNMYETINNTVKKIRQINNVSPTILAKAIIENIVESIEDKEEVKTKPFIPNMTCIVKRSVLIAVSYLGYNTDFVMEFLEVFELYISSFYDKTLTVSDGSRLVVFYTSFSRSYNLDSKVKYLIYDVLYTRNIKAYPMVFRIIQTWPDIIPSAHLCGLKDCLLTQTIIFILLSGTSSIDERLMSSYCTTNIRNHLQKFYGYKCDTIRKTELTDKIIEKITCKGGSLALVLLCKCEPWEWSCIVVETKLFPILQSFKSSQMNESTLCEYILTTGRIVRGFPITKAAYIVKRTLELFDIILKDSNSIHLSEVIIESISLLRRHNLMQCTSILMNWKPLTKKVTQKTMNHIKTILMVKNIMHWKHAYSLNFPNTYKNTRSFRSKRNLLLN